MVRPRTTRRRRTEFSDGDVEFLLAGRTFLPASILGQGVLHGLVELGRDELGAITAAWDELKAELMPVFVEANPGQRPWAWWVVDAPEPRRRVVRGHDGFPSAPKWQKRRLSFGVLRIYGKQAWAEGVVVESQAAFLDRHELLTDAERIALGCFETEETLWRSAEQEAELDAADRWQT